MRVLKFSATLGVSCFFFSRGIGTNPTAATSVGMIFPDGFPNLLYLPGSDLASKIGELLKSYEFCVDQKLEGKQQEMGGNMGNM